jgi:group I intron endonuclease
MRAGIYKITSPIGAIYIGQSVNIDLRIKRYKRLDCRKQIKLYQSFITYGFESHKIEIITECAKEDLNKLENYYGLLYNVLAPKNLNSQLPSANRKYRIYSDELKARLSKIKLGKRLPDSAYQNRTYSPHTDETKLKISQSNKGKKKHTEESKVRISNLMKILSSKPVLNYETGIYYENIQDAAKSLNKYDSGLGRKLNGVRPNKTKLAFV